MAIDTVGIVRGWRVQTVTLIYPVLALGEAYYVGPHTWTRTGRIVFSEKRL